MSRFEATLLGAREVGFTVLSMSLSLIAVFVPITLMGGVVGRFFNEFGIVLSSAVLISLVVSLTTTPMLCANLDLHKPDRNQGWLLRNSERAFQSGLRLYDRTLQWALANPGFIMIVLAIAVVLNFYLYFIVPKGFIPQEDTGDINGRITRRPEHLVPADAAEVRAIRLDHRQGPCGPERRRLRGRRRRRSARRRQQFRQCVRAAQAANRERGGLSTDQVIKRLQGPLSSVAGARLFLTNAGGVPGAGGRQGNGAYQYTLQADTLAELDEWMPKITDCAAGCSRARRASTPIGRTRGWRSISRSTATPRRGSASTRRRSTTRSMTPSASGRYRRSTTISTSTTW